MKYDPIISFKKAILFFLVLLFFGCKNTEKNRETVDSTKLDANAKTMNMANKYPPLITGVELFNMKDDKDLILIDARFSKAAKADYLESHLDGALHVDLNKQLSDIKDNPANGGRHPLPSVEEFSKLLTGLGISKESYVVIYDTSNGGMAAARFWWMLKSAGHKKLQVLNGGLKEAVKAGFPTNSGDEPVKTVLPYTVLEWQLPLAKINEVEMNAQNENHIVIDVRAQERYNGEVEPIDLIAGHIPGAVNVPLTGNVNAEGLFLSSAELKEKYKAILGDTPIENITIHCGSGVTACHTLLALNHAGFETPKLYVGSWSEWSRNDKPIATEN